jgi:hypothetical protein
MDEPTNEPGDDFPAPPPGVGPHDLRERDLLLAGEKPVAWFYDADWFVADIWAEFAEDVAAGRLIAVMARYEKPPHRLINLVVARPEEEEAMKAFFDLVDDLLRFRRKWTDEIDKRIGRFLGYSESDIEAFLLWQRQSS